MKEANSEIPGNNEVEKSKSHTIVDIVDYMPNAITDKLIIKKSTGHIRMMSFAGGQELKKRTYPFDIFVQIIEGKATAIINSVSHELETGQGIVIPAHASGAIQSDGPFKIIETLIKSGYELH